MQPSAQGSAALLSPGLLVTRQGEERRPVTVFPSSIPQSSNK